MNTHCLRRYLKPAWLCSPTHSAAIKLLLLTQVKIVGVEQELGEVEELGDELLDISHVVFGGGVPRLAHAVEHAVSQVKVPALPGTESSTSVAQPRLGRAALAREANHNVLCQMKALEHSMFLSLTQPI